MVNIEKSQPPPASLAKEKLKNNGRYNLPDVLEQLKEDFKNKCYLCEQKAPTSINIEHFIPHRRNRERMFDWNNLFWACEHCNKTKGHKSKFDAILNCTDPEHDVVNWIKYEMKPIPKEKVKISVHSPPNNHLEITKNTVDLLTELYNGTTHQKTLESDNLRQKILEEILDFVSLLNDYYYDYLEEEDREYYERKIIGHLKKSSAFTAFKRWIIKDNEALHRDFEHYFD